MMPPLRQTSQLPETNAMRTNQVYSGVLEQSKEASFKVHKNGTKSGFGDFYGNVKHFERVNDDKISKNFHTHSFRVQQRK